jgi:cell division protein ZapA
MGENSERITTVEIYGQTYHIRGATAPDHIAQLAGFVDEKMREVSEHTPTVDSLKVAVLAALNITDQYFSARLRLKNLEQMVTERSGALSDKLDSLVDAESP